MPVTVCKYFLYNHQNPVQKDSSIRKTPLPMNRKNSQNLSDISITHEDYFNVVCSFLTKNRFEMIRAALSQHIGHDTVPEDIAICLEKHGEFYHPSRIETVADGKKFLFVVNAALSETGKKCIKQEYNILKRLNNDFSYSFIPEVYGYGEDQIKDSIAIPIFIGEWFEGYHEFHLSQHSDENKMKIAVWDSEHGKFFLSENQAEEIYRQAAMIMTSYYNVESSEHIFQWHHAAGDFIVKIQNEKTELRLITVRDYRRLLPENPNKEKGDEAEAGNILAVMLLFFLNLSIRMRLDRLDGVGDIVWADDIAVKGTIEGFFQGLAINPFNNIFPLPLELCFRNYILSYTDSDISDLFKQIFQNCYHPLSPEFSVIEKNIKRHSDSFYQILKSL